MVGPFIHIPNARCAVRVPGNGTNRTSQTLLVDLSSVSPLAGMASARNPLTQSCINAGGAHASVLSKRQQETLSDNHRYQSSQVNREEPTQCGRNEASNTTTRSSSTVETESRPANRNRKRPLPEQEESKSPSKRSRKEDAPSKLSNVSSDRSQTKGIALAMPTSKSTSVAQQGALQKPRAVVKPTIKSAKLTTRNPPSTKTMPIEQRTNNSSTLPSTLGSSVGMSSSSTLLSSPSVLVLPPIQLQPSTARAVKSAQQLVQKVHQLRHENDSLKQKVTLFQQLFKNKDRLKSVLTGLGLQVVE